MKAEQFWLVVTIACLVWYSVVAAYVAVRGFYDVRTMLARLRDEMGRD